MFRYSTIIRVDSKNEEKRCNFELQYNEIPTKVKLPKLKGINAALRAEYKNGISIQNAIDAVEFVLITRQTSVMALTWSAKKKSILQQILSISELDEDNEIKEFNAVNLSKTLNDFKIDTLKLEAIQVYLSDHYNISRSLNNILSLSVQEILEIEKEILSDIDYEETPGLWTFISYLDKDELQATNKIIFMPTLTRSAAMTTFDVNETYLCIVPGIEGQSERFRIICERLKLSAFVLQPGFEKFETFPETAERFVQIMPKNALELHKKFYLLGYESGVFIALEMAAILEKKGWTGIVFCIGGSPDEIRGTVIDKLKEYDTEEALQIAVVKHMFTLMTADTKDIDHVLSNSLTWQERVDCCVRNLRGHVSYSSQFTREIIDTTYLRLSQLRHYNAEPRVIQSQLVSLSPKSVDVHHTSSFQSYSQKPVIEYNLNVPFAHLTKNSQCAAIINRYLDKDILEKFENTNLCESYIINDFFLVRS